MQTGMETTLARIKAFLERLETYTSGAALESSAAPLVLLEIYVCSADERSVDEPRCRHAPVPSAMRLSTYSHHCVPKMTYSRCGEALCSEGVQLLGTEAGAASRTRRARL